VRQRDRKGGSDRALAGAAFAGYEQDPRQRHRLECKGRGGRSKPCAGRELGLSENKPPAIDSMLIAIPPEQIVLIKSIVESYDNIATLRTEDPTRHHLRIYFSADSRDEVEAMMTSLAAQFEIERLA